MNRLILPALLAIGASCTLPHVAKANGGGFGIGIGIGVSFSANSSCCNKGAPQQQGGFPGYGGYQPDCCNPYTGSPYGMSPFGGFPYGGFPMGGYGQGAPMMGGYGQSPFGYGGFGGNMGGFELAPPPKEEKKLSDKPAK